MVIAPFNIRRYEPRDTDAAYDVCLRTGNDGEDASHAFDDPRALGHIYVGPYLQLEPQLAYVLEDPQGVCGYALGALDSKTFYDAYLNQWLPEIRRRHPEPAGNPVHWTRTEKTYYDYHHPEIFMPEPYLQYPSHLHIDLLPHARGRGLGREMMTVLLAELRARGSPGVHLGMGAANARAERFYKKLGFHELARVGDVLYLGKTLLPYTDNRMSGLELLFKILESGSILTEATFSNIDLEAVLDQRDDPSFENAWLTAFQRVETAARDQPVRATESRSIDAIREQTFKLAYKHTQHPEIASYVSDDFELIAKALVVLVNDAWVNALWLSYKRARFPGGSLDPEEGPLADLLE